jgi:ElaB/YqjD/DUF883 family membrane-anchored ribosome-binding protein
MMNTELITTQGNVEGTRDKLAKDLRTVVADADYLLKEVANSTAEEFAAARTRIGAKLSEARSRLDEARIAVTDRARHTADATHEYMMDNPWKVVGLAAVIGLIIGALVSRR